MPSKCCRDTPRCADCPVLTVRQRRFARESEDLVASVLLGTPRELPPAVIAQLEALAAARTRTASRI